MHSDNDEESLYACCCTQKVTVKGCHRYSIFWLSQSTDIFTKFNEVNLQLQGNGQACPWEWDSHGNPMGNVPWNGTGINCYRMGMGQINMSHGHALACPWECHSYANPMRNVPWDGTGQA